MHCIPSRLPRLVPDSPIAPPVAAHHTTSIRSPRRPLTARPAVAAPVAPPIYRESSTWWTLAKEISLPFEFEAHDCFLLVVSCVEHCLVEQLPSTDDSDQQTYNLIQSLGKLLLLVVYFTGSWDQFTGVEYLQIFQSQLVYIWKYNPLLLCVSDEAISSYGQFT